MKLAEANAVRCWLRAVVVCSAIASVNPGDCSAFSSDPPKDQQASGNSKNENGAKPTSPKALATATPVSPMRTPPPKFYERYIQSPPIKIKDPVTGEAQEWNFARYRYSLVVIIASWNVRSTELVALVRGALPEMQRRQVGILGIASHDSGVGLARWRQATNPGFVVGLADDAFVQAWSNPKVPTLWLIERTGNILQRIELPTDEDVLSVLRKLTLWTDF